MFRFGVQKRGWDDPDEIAEFARHIEASGYDELYSADHIGAVDPFTPLVPAALATERLRVGPLVLNNEFHQPALLARWVATVDRMTKGRLILGMGTGYAEDEHRSIGLELRPPGPRVTRFGESLSVLRSLLDDDKVDLDGEHHQVHLDSLGVRPVQSHLPFLVGGFGRRVVGLAGRYADIFQFTGLTDLPGGGLSAGGFAIEQVVERGHWLTEAAGERDAAIERSALVQVVEIGDQVTSDAELAQRFEIDESWLADTPFALVGSVQQVADKIHRIQALTGITHYVIRDPDAFAPVLAALQ